MDGSAPGGDYRHGNRRRLSWIGVSVMGYWNVRKLNPYQSFVLVGRTAPHGRILPSVSPEAIACTPAL
ncbi:hypothetical protein CBM2629_B40102 [Cupriavidus taiwanensis]|nr:hypothetical protein CBM2629_B40102 [Cupriavidus taiwanensis]